MDIGSAHSAGRTHVGHYAQKLSRFEQPQALGAGIGRDYGVAATFQRGSNVRHHRGLVLDEQYGQGRRLSDRLYVHRCMTPATAPTEAVSGVAGRRTMNVAPCPPVVL